MGYLQLMNPHGPNNFFFRLLVSPALMGLIFLLVGAILSRFPGRKINMFSGYRTRMSMLNQDTWDVANSFSGALMRKIGIAAIILGAALSALSSNIFLLVMLNVGLTIFSAILLIVLTERKLRDEFDQKGNRKPQKHL